MVPCELLIWDRVIAGFNITAHTLQQGYLCKAEFSTVAVKKPQELYKSQYGTGKEGGGFILIPPCEELCNAYQAYTSCEDLFENEMKGLVFLLAYMFVGYVFF